MAIAKSQLHGLSDYPNHSHVGNGAKGAELRRVDGLRFRHSLVRTLSRVRISVTSSTVFAGVVQLKLRRARTMCRSCVLVQFEPKIDLLLGARTSRPH